MSGENVEAFRRGVDSLNRRDVEAMLQVLDPEVEWHDVFGLMLGGGATAYRGHEGVRELFRDLYGAFAEIHSEYPEIRDLGNRTFATGRLSARGNESGAGIEAPIWTIAQWENGRVTWIRTYLDRGEALEAAGLSE